MEWIVSESVLFSYAYINFKTHLYKLHNVLYIDTDNERPKLPYLFKDDDKQCLNLIQKAQENFHLKETLVTNVCSCELEQQGWNRNVTNSLFNCQINIDKYDTFCKSDATEECKDGVLDFTATVREIVYDEKIKNCINTSMIGNNRLYNNDFLQFIEMKYDIEWKYGRRKPKGNTFETLFEKIETSCKY